MFVSNFGTMSIRAVDAKFDLPDCQGQAYLDASVNVLLKAGPSDSLRFFVPTAAPLVTVETKSRFRDKTFCENTVDTLAEAHALDEVTGALPFPLQVNPPIRVDLAF